MAMDAVREYIDDKALLSSMSIPTLPTTISKPDLSYLGCINCNCPCPHGSVKAVRARYKGVKLEGVPWSSLSNLAEGVTLSNYFKKNSSHSNAKEKEIKKGKEKTQEKVIDMSGLTSGKRADTHKTVKLGCPL